MSNQIHIIQNTITTTISEIFRGDFRRICEVKKAVLHLEAIYFCHERRRVASAMVSQIRDILTETPFRRIWMYYVGGMTVDEVGEKEDVSLQKCRRLSHFYFPSFAATNQRPFSNHR